MVSVGQNVAYGPQEHCVGVDLAAAGRSRVVGTGGADDAPEVRVGHGAYIVCRAADVAVGGVVHVCFACMFTQHIYSEK